MVCLASARDKRSSADAGSKGTGRFGFPNEERWNGGVPLGGMRAKNRSEPETKIVKVQLETLTTINIINVLWLPS